MSAGRLGHRRARWRTAVANGQTSQSVLCRGTTTTSADSQRNAPAASRLDLDVQWTRRTAWRISPTRLHSDSAVASVAVRLSVFTQLLQPATFTRQPRWRRTVMGADGRRCICAHSVDICVEVSEVVVPHAPPRQRVGADNSRSLLRISGPRSGARRLRSHQ